MAGGTEDVPARSALFGLHGDHPRSRGARVPVAGLVRLLVPLGITAPAAWWPGIGARPNTVNRSGPLGGQAPTSAAAAARNSSCAHTICSATSTRSARFSR